MFEMYTYEHIRALNDERLRKALRRHELNQRVTSENETVIESDADVIELVFGEDCPNHELTA